MNNETVQNLKKIKLGIEAGSNTESMNLFPSPLPLEIIFGIGPEGLTPLEFALSGKTEGENILLSLPKAEIPRFFEHNLPVEMVNPKHPDTMHLRIRIEAIYSAKGREIIRAMAALGGDCACSCGCGGHEASDEGCTERGCGDPSSCDGCG